MEFTYNINDTTTTTSSTDVKLNQLSLDYSYTINTLTGSELKMNGVGAWSFFIDVL